MTPNKADVDYFSIVADKNHEVVIEDDEIAVKLLPAKPLDRCASKPNETEVRD